MPNRPRLASVDTLVKLAREGEAGRHWYAYAADQVNRGAALLGIDADRFADLLALLSPRVSVKRNIRFAIRYATAGEHAPDVMRGIRSSVEYYEKTGAIRGPKTGPFARAIRGDLSAVVLDVWMAKAFGIDQELFTRTPVHAECTRRISHAARRLGWESAEVQAAVWCAAVKRSGRKPGSFKIVDDTLWGDSLTKGA